MANQRLLTATPEPSQISRQLLEVIIQGAIGSPILAHYTTGPLSKQVAAGQRYCAGEKTTRAMTAG